MFLHMAASAFVRVMSATFDPVAPPSEYHCVVDEALTIALDKHGFRHRRLAQCSSVAMVIGLSIADAYSDTYLTRSTVFQLSMFRCESGSCCVGTTRILST